MLGLRQIWLKRAIPPECKCLRLDISNLDSQCLNSTTFFRCFCVYAEGWGREMLPTRSFTPRKENL